MGKTITKKIEKVELVKVEKVFNRPDIKQKYIYNFFFEGLDEPLLLESIDVPLAYDAVGHKIKYKLNADNEVEDFEFI